MYGTREPFDYSMCPRCGTLHLLNPPIAWGRYYPDDSYYSMQLNGFQDVSTTSLRRLAFVEFLLRMPRIPSGGYSLRRTPQWARWFRGLGLRRDSLILDVGCGAGRLLHLMAADGFTRLRGVDPFVDASYSYRNGVKILRGEISDIEDRFDLVMFNHSFEHMDDPSEVLEIVGRIVKPGGAVLIRIPVADSWAFREYGADWIGLDAPRHQYIFTSTSLQLLAERRGYRIADVFFDSTGLQFWGSELYRQDSPLFPAGDLSHPADRFDAVQMNAFARRSMALNAQGEGDQAGFILRRPA